MKNQTFENFEVVLVEGGNCEKTSEITSAYTDFLSIQLFPQKARGLVSARNEAWMKAKGEAVAFIDDDIRPSPRWLEELANALETHKNVVGVGGPTLISSENIRSRDLTGFLFSQHSILRRAVKEIYFKMFLENKPFMVNRFFRSGGFSLGSMMKTVIETSKTITDVDYLDASNMCFRKSALEHHMGFDDFFLGVGDYSEPDLCFRIRREGGCLLFNPKAYVFHYPSRGGVYVNRSDAYYRSRNLALFHRRHFQANLRHFMYLFFLDSYFLYKGLSTRNRNWLYGVAGISRNRRRRKHDEK